jgi:hypothetical protein
MVALPAPVQRINRGTNPPRCGFSASLLRVRSSTRLLRAFLPLSGCLTLCGGGGVPREQVELQRPPEGEVEIVVRQTAHSGRPAVRTGVSGEGRRKRG